MSEQVLATALGLVGTALAIVASLIAQNKASKEDVQKNTGVIEVTADKLDRSIEDAKELEHRLTVLEENRFSAVDKECLQEIKTKMSFLWDAFKTFPSFLKKENTPELDKIWSKAQRNIRSLTHTEAKTLLEAMDEEIGSAVKTEVDVARAFAATIYRAVFKYELEEKNNGVNKHGCK